MRVISHKIVLLLGIEEVFCYLLEARFYLERLLKCTQDNLTRLEMIHNRKTVEEGWRWSTLVRWKIIPELRVSTKLSRMILRLFRLMLILLYW